MLGGTDPVVATAAPTPPLPLSLPPASAVPGDGHAVRLGGVAAATGLAISSVGLPLVRSRCEWTMSAVSSSICGGGETARHQQKAGWTTVCAGGGARHHESSRKGHTRGWEHEVERKHSTRGVPCEFQIWAYPRFGESVPHHGLASETCCCGETREDIRTTHPFAPHNGLNHCRCAIFDRQPSCLEHTTQHAVPRT